MRSIMTGKTQTCLKIPLCLGGRLQYPIFCIFQELNVPSTKVLQEWDHSEGVCLVSPVLDGMITERSGK